MFALLDDVYIASASDRVVVLHEAVAIAMERCGIKFHEGKTRMWNAGGIAPSGREKLRPNVWKGDPSRPAEDQGLFMLGAPVGHDE